jgi:hypothetical protein
VNVLDKSFDNNSTPGNTVPGKFVFQVGANSGQTIDHTIDVFSFGDPDGLSTTKVVAETAAGTATTIEVSTLTVGGTYAAGDVISVNLNQNIFQRV